MFFIGFLTGVITIIILLIIIVPKVMFLVNESKYSFKETILKIEDSVSKNKWSLPGQYDLQATMKKHGFDVLPVRVFSICKPSLAHIILSGNKERYVSALMPCRLAVYQKKNGKTYISRMNAELFSKVLGKKIKKVMAEASHENDLIIQSVLK